MRSCDNYFLLLLLMTFYQNIFVWRTVLSSQSIAMHAINLLKHRCYAIFPYRIVAAGLFGSLLDLDPSGCLLDNFWHNHAQDAIFQASLDSLLVNSAGETEAALEFSDGALTDPVLESRL